MRRCSKGKGQTCTLSSSEIKKFNYIIELFKIIGYIDKLIGGKYGYFKGYVS
jgi:hypothetical protein